MENYSLSKRFGRKIPVLLGLAAVVLVLAIPTAGAVERGHMIQRAPMVQGDEPRTGHMQMGFEPQWYDPRAWFESGGNLEHEADWYDYSFAYRQPGAHGYWGPHGEQPPFGYFGERPVDEPGLYYGQDIELNYYTTDWYNREGTLEGWL